jgi:hypothetical protein
MRGGDGMVGVMGMTSGSERGNLYMGGVGRVALLKLAWGDHVEG